MTTIHPRPGFDWTRVNWGGPNERRTDRCSYCGDKFPEDDDSDFIPLILWNAEGWTAEFCDHCQAAWFGIHSFPDPADDGLTPEQIAALDRLVSDERATGARSSAVEPAAHNGLVAGSTPAAPTDDDLPDLGPCCMCEGTEAVNNIVMLSRRGAVPGHGWGCVVCHLPMDGAYAVLCNSCLPKWQADNSLLTIACRGFPRTHGRIPIAELPPGKFDHDEAIDHG